MGEVSEIRRKMEELYTRAVEAKHIDTGEIQRELEPLFQKYGYREQKEDGLQRILLYHDDGVGDFINCSPAIRAVRQAFPKAQITLLVHVRARDLALTCPYVDQIFVDEQKCDRHEPLGLLRWYIDFSQKLLPMRFDVCINFIAWGSSVLLSYLCGAARRVDYDPSGFECSGPYPYNTVSNFVTDYVPCKLRGIHSIYRYLPLAEYLTGQEIEDCHPELWVLAVEKERWQKKLQQQAEAAKWIAVVLGGTDARHHWPVQNYAQLLKLIIEEDRASSPHFLILGGSENQADGDALVKKLPEHRAWNLAGKLIYRESIAALSCCCMYVGNDTGLLHAAAAAGLPVLSPCCYAADLPMGINAVPIKQFPYGVPSVLVRPAHALDICKSSKSDWGCIQLGEAHCIAQISPELMLEGYRFLENLVQQGRNERFFLYETENPAHQGKATSFQSYSNIVFQS